METQATYNPSGPVSVTNEAGGIVNFYVNGNHGTGHTNLTNLDEWLAQRQRCLAAYIGVPESAEAMVGALRKKHAKTPEELTTAVDGLLAAHGIADPGMDPDTVERERLWGELETLNKAVADRLSGSPENVPTDRLRRIVGQMRRAKAPAVTNGPPEGGLPTPTPAPAEDGRGGQNAEDDEDQDDEYEADETGESVDSPRTYEPTVNIETEHASGVLADAKRPGREAPAQPTISEALKTLTRRVERPRKAPRRAFYSKRLRDWLSEMRRKEGGDLLSQKLIDALTEILPPRHFTAYMYIRALAYDQNHPGLCWISHETLGRRIHAGERTARRITQDLRGKTQYQGRTVLGAGLIVLARQGAGLYGTANAYRIVPLTPAVLEQARKYFQGCAGSAGEEAGPNP